jgi:NAD(P)-dependent dehydrogenase (short-subunit alcohol dehydrogenase family)
VSGAVQKIKDEFPAAGVSGVAADLGTPEGVESLYRDVPYVDILVNNLGIFEPKPFFEITDGDWQKFFDVNVMSGVRMSRHYTPGMVQRKWGRVIFIASESAIQIPGEMVHYGMTKTAQLAVSRGIAATVAGTGVTVNTVMPGPTWSEGVEVFVQGMVSDPDKDFEAIEKEFFETARPGSLINRFATPEEIANLVTYIASPLSSATTGAALRADGGVANFIL